jgi:hypothetical protein
MYVWRNTRARSYNHCCRRKCVSITCSESMSGNSGFQLIMRMHHIAICPLYGSPVCFHIISYTALFKENLLPVKFVFLFYLQLLTETFLIQRRIKRDIINRHTYSCRAPVILDRFEPNSNFLDRFSKNTQISNFMEIRLVETELFHTDGQINITKLMFAFRNFADTS